MTPSKQKIIEESNRKRAIILAILGKKRMTADEIIAAAPEGSGITPDMVGSMKRAGILDSRPTARRNPHGNILNDYGLAGKKEKHKKKPEFSLYDVFPVHVPQDGKLGVVFDMDIVGHYGQAAMTPHRGYGVQSSMVSLINEMGG